MASRHCGGTIDRPKGLLENPYHGWTLVERERNCYMTRDNVHYVKVIRRGAETREKFATFHDKADAMGDEPF